MEVNLPRKTEARLHQLAARRGKNAASLIEEAIDRLLDHDKWFVREVEKGVAQAKRGELIDHEQVVKRIENRLKQKHRSC